MVARVSHPDLMDLSWPCFPLRLFNRDGKILSLWLEKSNSMSGVCYLEIHMSCDSLELKISHRDDTNSLFLYSVIVSFLEDPLVVHLSPVI